MADWALLELAHSRLLELPPLYVGLGLSLLVLSMSSVVGPLVTSGAAYVLDCVVVRPLLTSVGYPECGLPR